jgi:sec-independent protein translocase protein TatA
MPNVGPMELAIVLIVALVIFGPKKLPDLGRGLGSGMREFKESITGGSAVEESRPRALATDSEQRPDRV